jgi:hypothetical protein
MPGERLSNAPLVIEAPAYAARARLTPRLAIAATFLAFGVAFGLWAGSSSAILGRTGLGPGIFGLMLSVFTGAYLAAMSGANVLARQFTVKRTLIAALLAIAPILAGLLAASSPLTLGVGLIAYGTFAGALDATMNAEGARIEKRFGVPILARLHGGASTGTAFGAILGSLLATGAAPWASSLIAATALGGAAILVTIAIPSDAGDLMRGRLEVDARLFSRTLVVLGLTVGVCIACESATLSWSALLLREEAPRWAAFAGLGAAFFAACQAALRFNADWLRLHLGDRSLILLSLGVAAIGLGVVAAHAGFAPSVIGFAIVGVGTGSIVPCGFVLAASRPHVSAGASISAVAFIGGFPRLPAPFVTGAVANAFSLSTTFFCLAALLLAAFAAVVFFVPRRQHNPRGARLVRP